MLLLHEKLLSDAMFQYALGALLDLRIVGHAPYVTSMRGFGLCPTVTAVPLDHVVVVEAGYFGVGEVEELAVYVGVVFAVDGEVAVERPADVGRGFA